MLNLKRMGVRTIAQSEETCTVFGMPKEAIAMGAVDLVEDTQDIASKIAELSWPDEKESKKKAAFKISEKPYGVAMPAGFDFKTHKPLRKKNFAEVEMRRQARGALAIGAVAVLGIRRDGAINELVQLVERTGFAGLPAGFETCIPPNSRQQIEFIDS